MKTDRTMGDAEKSHQALGREFFSTSEIRALAERSDLWGWWLVAHCWGTIALALGLFALWPNPLTFVLAVVIIGSRQLGLAILMHEAAHNALFRSRGLNELGGGMAVRAAHSGRSGRIPPLSPETSPPHADRGRPRSDPVQTLSDHPRLAAAQALARYHRAHRDQAAQPADHVRAEDGGRG
jgi:hypothetical protein